MLWIMWTKSDRKIMLLDKSPVVGDKFKKRVNDYVNLKSTWIFEFYQKTMWIMWIIY